MLSLNIKRSRESDHRKLSEVTEPEPLIRIVTIKQWKTLVMTTARTRKTKKLNGKRQDEDVEKIAVLKILDEGVNNKEHEWQHQQ